MKQKSKTPVRVAITGAAGQIGYQLAFRIASGQLFGAGSTDHLAAARDHTGARRAERRRHGARRLRVRDAARRRRHGQGRRRVQGHQLRPARRRAATRPRHGAQGLAARERADLLRARQGARRRRGSARQDSRRRQSREHERADRTRKREGPRPAQFHGHDAARSQPREGAARREDGLARQRRPRRDRLGQSLRDAVPGSRARDRRRQAGAIARLAELVSRGVHPDRAAARRRDHQGARRVVGRFGRFGGHRSRARLGARHGRRRLGQHGRRVGRQLRHQGRRRLLVSRALRARRVSDRAGALGRRVRAAARWPPPRPSCAKNAPESQTCSNARAPGRRDRQPV